MTSKRIRFDIRESGGVITGALVVLFVVNAAFYLFWVRPKEQSLDAMGEDGRPRLEVLKEREKAVEARETYLESLRQAEADLQALRHDILSTRARRMIATDLEFTRIAREFNVEFARIQYENEILEDEAIERYAIVVPLEAGYASLRRFIQAVESSERFLVVERVALAQGELGGSLLQLNITLATYFDHPPSREKQEQTARRTADRRRG
jgi:Tfp pilus assembly protein PilO